MNVELLRKVKDYILAEPKRLHMGDWGCKFSNAMLERRPELRNVVPICQTTACIAGWAVILEKPELLNLNPDNETEQDKFQVAMDHARAWASDLLELDYEEGQRLFYELNWPILFCKAYERAKFSPTNSAAKKAQVAAERIEFFIATNGTDNTEEVSA